ncbi:NAC domain containing protein [Quillaja saponaria]|uniref:NAC domain containing protein n=1 Tax=Quillaja saponaria TaxID=32244 RepID=A0AAD7QGV0_QUISA|nr:NAC domain containing protein [Quillaja saponaria]
MMDQIDHLQINSIKKLHMIIIVLKLVLIHTGVFEQDKGAGCCSKRSSSSSESHSMEQIDSTSESNQKLVNELTYTESSSHQKDMDEEDFYAEILKDDIIKLDESLQAAAPKILPMGNYSELVKDLDDKFDAERRLQDPAHAIPSQTLPFQGTAHRRIRLKRYKSRQSQGKLEAVESGNKDYSIGGVLFRNSETSSLSMFSIRTINHKLVFVFVSAVLGLIVLLLSLLGGYGLVEGSASISKFGN